MSEPMLRVWSDEVGFYVDLRCPHGAITAKRTHPQLVRMCNGWERVELTIRRDIELELYDRVHCSCLRLVSHLLNQVDVLN